ncbi:hypothetical protein GBA52_009228 [Prunus armeniaca]|nr:hypothetical protein GBA52_009228 [Prunus armeniaca]
MMEDNLDPSLALCKREILDSIPTVGESSDEGQGRSEIPYSLSGSWKGWMAVACHQLTSITRSWISFLPLYSSLSNRSSMNH